MNVNQAVYGAPETWIHVLPLSGYNSENKNLVPAWQTIGGGISASKINFPEPIDNSICYAAIADDSPIAEINTFAANNTDNPLQTLPIATPIFPAFLDTASYGKFTSSIYDISENKDMQIYAPNESLPDNNLNKYIQPMCSISPKDAVLKTVIRAYKSDWTTFKTFKYNEYLTADGDGDNYSNYPHIFHIYALFYARIENSETRRRQYIDIDNVGGFFIARDLEYESPAWGTIRDYAVTSLKGGSFNGVHVWGISDVNGRPYWGDTPNYIYKSIGSGGTIKKIGSSIIMYHDYDASDDFVHRCVASFGLFFCDDDNTAENGAYNSNKMMLGVIDENGLTHGVYTYGEDNETQQQYDWTSTNESTYDPSKSYDTSRYDNTTLFYNNVAANNFTRRYVLSEYWIETLSTELWQLLQGVPAGVSMEEYCAKTFLTSNPIDCIISLKKFPLAEIEGGELTPIHMGAYTASTAGRPLANLQKVIDFTFSRANRNSIYPVFDNTFLDYEPYTTAALVIPFCGSIQLPLAEFLDKNGSLSISVKLVIDYVTGAVTAYVINNGKCLYTSQGNCSIDLPVSGIQSYTLDSQIFNANQSLKLAEYNKTFTKIEGDLKIAGGGIGGAIAGAKKGGPFGAVAGAFTGSTVAGVSAAKSNMIQNFNVQNSEYSIEHTELPLKTVGSASAVTSNAFDMRCKIIIERPVIDSEYRAEIYADTIGYACIITDTLENFSGFTKCAAVNLDGVPCTAEEKTMINNALLSGAYL